MGLLRIGGYICLAAAVVLGALAAFIPEARFGLILGAGGLVAAGVIDLWVARFLTPVMESLPKPEGVDDVTSLRGTMKMSRGLMHQGAVKMESATATLREMNRANHLREHGLKARARVLAIRDTQQLINYDPILEFDLEVVPEDGYVSPYRVDGHRQVVSKIVYPHINVGSDYAAFVDPEDQNSVFVSWQ